MVIMKKILFVICVFAGFLMAANGTENLLLDAGKGNAHGWPPARGVRYEVKDQLLSVTIDGHGGAGKRIPLKPEWKYLVLSMNMRLTGVAAGKQGWQNGRLAMRFFDQDNKGTGPWPDVFNGSGTSGARKCVRVYEIPQGAASLEISPANFGTSGRVEFTGMSLTPLESLEKLNKDAMPPDGSSPERLWDLADAFRIVTPTRETVCLNGLWNFFPVRTGNDAGKIPPDGSGWGYFKVPGIWPGMGWGSNQPGDSSIITLSEFAGTGFDPAKMNSAWYRRTVEVPAGWAGRDILLEITMLQTCAQVFVDGKAAGEMYYPGGRINLAGRLLPGRKQELALLVSAKKDGLTGSVFMAPGRLVKEAAVVRNRGITGDVFLTAEPKRAAISDVHVLTSYRKKQIACDVGISRAVPGSYYLEADIRDGGKSVKRFRSAVFRVSGGNAFRKRFSADWLAPKLWDTDAPGNLYTAEVHLRNADGTLSDSFFPQEFGFREFWCEGRNFMLNGSVIHLRSMAASTMREGAARSSAEVTAQMAERAKKAGFNHLIAYNYSFAPGIVGYQDNFYIQASKAGVLTSLTMPHASNFQWNLDDPSERKRYLAQAEFLIRRFQNLPGVVLYAATHNASGYLGDQNPQRLDGIYTPDAFRKNRNRIQALNAGKLINSIDPSRPVYHHESGNLGDLITLNCYLNWVPAQERSDWLEYWEKNGVKPLILVEWGLPHTPSWSSYRGPGFIYSAKGVQCIWLNEYNASLLGEGVYRTEPGKEKAYRAQEKISAGNKPVSYVSIFPYREATLPVCAEMVRENFREMRARGVSGLLPWDMELFWRRTGTPVSGVWPGRFRNLKQPGIVPDLARPGGDYLVDWRAEYEPTAVGKAGLPWMRELVAWIAGKNGDFTEKGHNFRPGETVEKQVMLLNDSRRIRSAKVRWSVPELNLTEEKEVRIEPGRRFEVPVRFSIPAGFAGEEASIVSNVRFETGKEMSDRLRINVIHPGSGNVKSVIGLYDPEGKSTGIMRELGIPFRVIRDASGLKTVDLLVVGREGLKRPFPGLGAWMESGRKLLVLEQDFATLDRMGFRGNEYGLRNVFPLVPEFSPREIRNWRGSSTLTAPALKLPKLEESYPKWIWHGFANSRAWRAGNRGNVCSVLLEKPTVGNFLPLMQGGFDLQYAPALELKSGGGAAIFSQFDLSGRTETDPEAVEILRKLILRLDSPERAKTVPVRYAGNREGEELLKTLSISFQKTDRVPETGLLVIGPGARLPELSGAVEKGLRVLMLGLSNRELNALLPGKFNAVPGKYYSDYVENPAQVPEFTGISNADLHWRKELPIDAFDAAGPGGRALRAVRSGKGTAVALQVVPWLFDPAEFQFRTSRKRNTGLVSRLLHNLGAQDCPGVWRRLLAEKRTLSMIPLTEGWIGKADPGDQGRKERWHRPGMKTDASWRPVKVPGKFDLQFDDLKGYDGLFWYRLTFDLPEKAAPESDCVLSLGPVDDESWIWLNGHFLGEVTAKTHPEDYWTVQRTCRFKGKLLRPGKNQLTVLCNDLRENGGILGAPRLQVLSGIRFYADLPLSSDDPYRYYRW